MIRTFALVATLAALAAPAHAEEVRINIVGKDMVSLKAEIDAAVDKVCRTEMRVSVYSVGMYATCVDILTKDALAQVEAARAGFGVASTKLEVTPVSTAQ